jgi:hypothetical protein
MNKPILTAILSALLCPAAAWASDYTFMRPCPRANAMGSAFSTVEGDACAVFYNPAALTTLENLEVRFDTARRLSGDSPAGEVSGAYIRPVPDTDNKVAGLGFYSIRQKGSLGLDSLSFSLGNRTKIKYLQQPLYYGGGVKLVSVRDAEKSHIGIGVDAGILLHGSGGLRTSLVLSDLVFGAGKSLTSITLGNSYRVKKTLLLADLRARGSYSELFLGAEHPLFNGLAAARAGKGVSMGGGGDYLALGLGVNTLPWTLDLAWSIPWAGYNRNAGYYGLSASYRFGSETFSEKLVGDASKEADELKNQIDDLRAQKANLDSAIAAARVNKSIVETDVTLLQSRMRELEGNLKALEVQILEAQYRKDAPKPPQKKYAPPPPERWPKYHKAAAGDTLRSIAGRYYGNPSLWELIYDANEKNISKGAPVEGATLVIPPPPAGNK